MMRMFAVTLHGPSANVAKAAVASVANRGHHNLATNLKLTADFTNNWCGRPVDPVTMMR